MLCTQCLMLLFSAITFINWILENIVKVATSIIWHHCHVLIHWIDLCQGSSVVCYTDLWKEVFIKERSDLLLQLCTSLTSQTNKPNFYLSCVDSPHALNLCDGCRLWKCRVDGTNLSCNAKLRKKSLDDRNPTNDHR